MKKLLLVTYYWPPSGGAGVQRWLKLSKYLHRAGVEVHVLAPKAEQASYMAIDKSLLEDIEPGVHVHRTDSFEIINYYAKLVGKEKVPTAGFSNVDNTSWKQQLVTGLRSNLFIPDPRRGWVKYAVQTGLQLIETFGIDTVITTSPPHSSQLIGLKLKQRTGVRWIVDFRDPWTDVYYYPLLNHSRLSAWIDQRYEQRVIEYCDAIITVSNGFKDIFARKLSPAQAQKISVIPNGYDAEDFPPVADRPRNDRFTFTYTGTMSVQYDPEVVFQAIHELLGEQQDLPFLLKLVGMLSSELVDRCTELGIPFEHVPTVPHKEVVPLQRGADLLLLAIPESTDDVGIVPGKLFEYLASGRRILGLGPTTGDIARILGECAAGQVFDRSAGPAIVSFLRTEVKRWQAGGEGRTDAKTVARYSREAQANTLIERLAAPTPTDG